MNVRTFGHATLLGGALCTGLLAGCGDGSDSSPPKAAVISGKDAAKAATDGGKAPGAAVSTQGAAAAGAQGKTAADAAATAGAAMDETAEAMSKAAADVEAALAAVPSQEQLDMEAAKTITDANADAELEKLMKEIDKDSGK